MTDLSRTLVRIVDPNHPHYPESGYLTGKVVDVLGTPMAEVLIAGCVHGTAGCFVEKGQIEIERRRFGR